MDFDATQALSFSDEETDEETSRSEKKQVAELKVFAQRGIPETVFPIYEGDNVIGRQGDSCDVHIPSKSLSKQHACIEVKGGAHLIYDKGSRNKTRRKKRFLTEDVRYELCDDDRLMFADVECQYHITAAAPVDDDTDETASEAGSESMLIQGTQSYVVDSDQDNSMTVVGPSQAKVVAETPFAKPASKPMPRGLADNTQYIPESDTDEDEDDFILSKPSTGYGDADMATQAAVSPARGRVSFGAATQLCPAASSSEDSSNRLAADDMATQAFDAAGGIGTTVARSADDDSDATGEEAEETQLFDSEEQEKPAVSAIDLGAATLAQDVFDDDEEEESLISGNVATQAFVNYQKHTTTSGSANGDVTDDNQATQFMNDGGATLVLGDNQATQVVNDGGATLLLEDNQATQVVNDGGATLVLGDNQATQVANDGGATLVLGDDQATQVANDGGETLVLGDDQATQVATDGGATLVLGDDQATQVVNDGGATLVLGDDQATQVVTDGGSTLVLGDDQATQVVNDGGATLVLGDDQATQVATDGGTTLVLGDDQVTQVATDGGATLVLGDDQATQVVNDGGATLVLGDDQATQVTDDAGATLVLSDNQATQVEYDDGATLVIGDNQATQVATDGGATLVLSDNQDTQSVDDGDAIVVEEKDRITKSAADVRITCPDSKGLADEGGQTPDPFAADTQSPSPAYDDTLIVPNTPDQADSSTADRIDSSPVQDLDATQIFSLNTPLLQVSQPPEQPGKVVSTRRLPNSSGEEDIHDEPTQIFDPAGDATFIFSEPEPETPVLIVRNKPARPKENSLLSEFSPAGTSTQELTEDVPKLSLETSVNENDSKNDGDATKLCAPNTDMLCTQPYTLQADEAVTDESNNKPTSTCFIDETQPYDVDEDNAAAEDKAADEAVKESDVSKEVAADSGDTLAYSLVEDGYDEPDSAQAAKPAKKNETTGKRNVMAGKRKGKIGKKEEKTGKNFKSNNNTDNLATLAYDMDVGAAVNTDKLDTQAYGIDCEAAVNTDNLETQAYDMDVDAQLNEDINKKANLTENTDRVSAVFGRVYARRTPRKVPSPPATGDDLETQPYQMDAECVEDSQPDSDMPVSALPDLAKLVKNPAETAASSETLALLTDASSPALSPSPPHDKQSSHSKQTDTNSEGDTGVASRQRATRKGRGKTGKKAEDDKTETTPKKSVAATNKTSKGSGKKSKEEDTSENLVMLSSGDRSRKQRKSGLDKTDMSGTDSTDTCCNISSVSQTATTARQKEKAAKTRSKAAVVIPDSSSLSSLETLDVESDVPRSRRSQRTGTSSSRTASSDSNSSSRSRKKPASSSHKSTDNEAVSSRSRRKTSSQQSLNVADGTNVCSLSEDSESASLSILAPSEVMLSSRRSRRTTGRSVPSSDSQSSTSSEATVTVKIELDAAKSVKDIESTSGSDRNATKSRRAVKRKTANEDTPDSLETCGDSLNHSKNTPSSVLSEKSSDTSSRGKNKALKKSSSDISEEAHVVKVKLEAGSSSSCMTDGSVTESSGESLGNSNDSFKAPAGRAVRSKKVSHSSEALPAPQAPRARRASSRQAAKTEAVNDTVDSKKDIKLVETDSKTSRRIRSTMPASENNSIEDKAEKDSKPPITKSGRCRSNSSSSAKSESSAASSAAESVKDAESQGKDTSSKGKTRSKRQTAVSDTSASPSKKRRASSPATPRTPVAPRASAGLPPQSPDTPSLRRKSVLPKPHVMFTGMVDEQGQRTVEKLGGTLASSIHDCSHLVTDQVRRTVKFLCGVARGLPIVHAAWLDCCKDANTFLDCSSHIVKDKASEQKYSFCLQTSIETASRKRLLAGYKCFLTKNIKPEPDQMADIVTCSGGEVLKRMPCRQEDNVLVVASDKDQAACQAAVDAGVTVVSAECLLLGVLRQELDIDSHRLFTKHQSDVVDKSRSSRIKRDCSSSAESRSNGRKRRR